MTNTPTGVPTTLLIQEIHPDPNQPRQNFDKHSLDLLTESIRRVGLLLPLRVRFTSSRWVLIDGHRRWLAAQAAGLERVPVIVEERGIDAGEATIQSLAANIVRCDLNPVERGEAIQSIMDLQGRPASAIAKDVGISEATASKLLTILLLNEADKQRVRDGTLGFAAAYRLASGRGTRIVIQSRNTDAPPSRPRSRPTRPKALRVALGVGASLVLRPTVALDAIADALSDIASRLRAAHAEGLLSPEFLTHTPA